MSRGQVGVVAAVLAAGFFGWAMGRRSPSAPAAAPAEPPPAAPAPEPSPSDWPELSEPSRGSPAPPPIAPQLLKSAPTLPTKRFGDVTARAGALALAREPAADGRAASVRQPLDSPRCPQGTMDLILEGKLLPPSSAPGPELSPGNAAAYRRAVERGDYVLLADGDGPAIPIALIANPVRLAEGQKAFRPFEGRRVSVSGCGGLTERFVVYSIRAVD